MTASVVCCPLSSDECEAASFYHAARPRARKPHTCCECGEPIALDQEHERATGKWDGSFATYRTCLSCVEIRTHFACNGWLFGQLWIDLEQNFFPDMKAGGPCMDGLSPDAKGRLFDRRLKWLEDS